MKDPYITVNEDGKKRKIYKKLFCYSILTTNKNDKSALAIIHIIQNGKKIAISPPLSIGSVKDYIENLKKELEDIYIDEDGFTVCETTLREFDSIDIYFEKY